MKNKKINIELKNAIKNVKTNENARAVLFHLLGGLSVLNKKNDSTIAACVARALLSME